MQLNHILNVRGKRREEVCCSWVFRLCINSVFRERKLCLDWIELSTRWLPAVCEALVLSFIDDSGHFCSLYLAPCTVYTCRWSLGTMLGNDTLLLAYHSTHGASTSWGVICIKTTGPSSLCWVLCVRKWGLVSVPLRLTWFQQVPPVKAIHSRPRLWCFLGCPFHSGSCVRQKHPHFGASPSGSQTGSFQAGKR